jgi:outer membrane lipoprotein LolB
MIFRLFFSSILFVVTACTQQAVIISAPPDAQRWQQHVQQSAEISRWHLNGRAAIHNSHDGGQLDIFWEQRNEHEFDIRLVAPFGSGSSQLAGSSQGVVLVLPDGETAQASTVDELLRQNPQWSFPVSNLMYWIRGIPSPHTAATLHAWNAEGLLQHFEQDGWSIELQNYREVNAHRLPGKIFAQRIDGEKLDVRLVIREWNLP